MERTAGPSAGPSVAEADPGPDGGPDPELSPDLAELRRRLDRAHDAGAEVLAADLETAYEELRVADEEVRVQRDQIASLLHGEELFRLRHERMLAVLPVPMLVTDALGVIRSANAAAAGLLDMRIARMVGKPAFALFHAEHRSGLRRMLADCAADRLGGQVDEDKAGAPAPATVVSRGGEELPVDVAMMLETGGPEATGRVSWMLLAPGGLAEAPWAREFPDALARLARLPSTDAGVGEVLKSAAEICRTILGPGVELSITIGSPLEPEAVASSSPVAQAMDGAQIAAGQGPCVTAYDEDTLVTTDDVRADPRWPALAAAVPDVVREVASLPLDIGGRRAGALNTYGVEPGLGRSFVATAELVAATLGAVLHELELRSEIDKLALDMTQALTSRAVIDQAKGIVMGRRGCDADEAFAHLVDLSSERHQKVRETARLLVEDVSRGPGQDVAG